MTVSSDPKDTGLTASAGDGFAPLLDSLLRRWNGRDARVLVVGRAAAELIKAHGHDPMWIVDHATVRGDGIAIVDGIRPARAGSYDLVVYAGTLEVPDFPWVAVQDLARTLVSGGTLILANPATERPTQLARHFDTLARWADLVPSTQQVTSTGVVVLLAEKPRLRGARRLVGLSRQQSLWRLGSWHARRRVHADVPELEPAPAPTADAYSDLMATAAFASVPPREVYEHRLLVLQRLQESGVVEFGTGSYGVPEVIAYDGAYERFLVGNWCSLADDVRIVLGGNHPTDRATTYPFRARYGLPGAHEDGYPVARGDVVLGNDVWLGRGAMLLSGVHVGDGAVVGAGAVVAGPVEPYAVVVGNPARVVRKRFDDDTIARLLEARWWDWPESELLDIVPLLNDGSVEGLLAYADRRRRCGG